MDSASSSILCNSCFLLDATNRRHSACALNVRLHQYSRPLLLSTTTNLCFRPTPSNSNRLVARNSTSSFAGADSSSPVEEISILLEVDGVLIDAHRSGNLLAFNIAFKKLGLDCANWTKPVYSDLVRKAFGDEERMLILFFNRIGWPTSLPTTEREAFIQKLLQEKKNAMGELVMSKDLPLRPGVEKFIDDALHEEIPVAILAASSTLGEESARATVERLGHERVSKLKIIGSQEVERSLYGQIMSSQRGLSGESEEIANEASKAVAAEKKRVAEEVASKLKLRVDIKEISSESIQKIVAVLRAAAEYVGAPVQNSVLVAGSKPAMAAAERVGMPFVVLTNSLTPRSAFPSAKAVMDSFGDVDLTVSKLRNKLQS